MYLSHQFKKLCQGNVKSSPWSELDGLQPETKIINEQLVKINGKGFLTVNSQPAVNGERSDSPVVGEQLILCLNMFLKSGQEDGLGCTLMRPTLLRNYLKRLVLSSLFSLTLFCSL